MEKKPADLYIRTLPSVVVFAPVVTVCQSAVLAAETTTPFRQSPLATHRLPNHQTVSEIGNQQVTIGSLANRWAGIRIKATAGDTGTIKGVTYSGITLSSITRYAMAARKANGKCSP